MVAAPEISMYKNIVVIRNCNFKMVVGNKINFGVHLYIPLTDPVKINPVETRWIYGVNIFYIYHKNMTVAQSKKYQLS